MRILKVIFWTAVKKFTLKNYGTRKGRCKIESVKYLNFSVRSIEISRLFTTLSSEWQHV